MSDCPSRQSQAYRARIRERYAERTHAEAQLAALQTAAPQDNDPALLDALPTAAAVLADAPERIKAALIDAFGIQAFYNKDMNQVTIWASLTDATPAAQRYIQDPDLSCTKYSPQPESSPVSLGSRSRERRETAAEAHVTNRLRHRAGRAGRVQVPAGARNPPRRGRRWLSAGAGRAGACGSSRPGASRRARTTPTSGKWARTGR